MVRPSATTRGSSTPTRPFLAIPLLFVICGCTVGPDYVPPRTELPDKWNQAAISGLEDGTASLQTWWRRFDDPFLNSLITKAHANNISLRMAARRIDEAMAIRGITRSEYFGNIDAAGTAQALRSSAGTTPVPPGSDQENGFYSAGLEAAWEADLWGRIRRSVESAGAGVDVSIEDYRDVLVLLNAQVAGAYVDARTFQNQIDLTGFNVDLQRATMQLTKDRYAAGLVAELDVHRAELNLARTESSLPLLRSDLKQAVNALSVLLGELPGPLQDEFEKSTPIPTASVPVFVGVPADLLRQRPDIRRAERSIAGQNARIGVATSDWYPRFFISGDLKLDSLGAAGFFNTPNVAYAFGPQVRWNLFDGGRIRNQVNLEELRTEQAVSIYEDTVLRAVEDVENAMVYYVEQQERVKALARSVTAAEASVAQVQDLYKSGLTDFQNVLDMERSLFEQQNLQAQSRGNIAHGVISIYRAVGGGWRNESNTNIPTTASLSREINEP